MKDKSLKVTFMGREYTTDQLYKEGLYGQWLRCCVVRAHKLNEIRIDALLKGATMEEALALKIPFSGE